MMTTGNLSIAAATDSGRSTGGGGGENGGGGFLDTLAQRITEATGKSVSPEALAAWLEGEAPAGLPGDATLTRLLGELLAGGGLEGEAAPLPALEDAGEEEPVDVAALLGMLAAVTRRGGGSLADGAADDLMGRLRERGGSAARRLLDGLRGGGGEAVAGRFEQLVQTAAAAMEPAQATRQSVEVPTLRVSTPVNSPGFGQAVGERVVWMVRNEVQQARIQLNPPGLGPLEVTLSLRDDRATVAITAHHAVTRDAMSADAPRLRAMLTDQGFASVDVDVSRDGGAEAFGQREQPQSRSGGGLAGVEPAAETAAPVQIGRGLVDHYV